MVWSSLVLSVLLVVIIVQASDAERVWALLAGVDGRWFWATFLVSLPQTALLGLRWARIAGWFGISLGWFRASAEVALSVALNQLLPGGFAGDGVRAWRQRRAARSDPLLRILEAVLLDRLSGQLALWAFVLLGLPWMLRRGVLGEWRLPALSAGLGSALLALALLAALGFGWFRIRVRFGSWLGRSRRFLARTGSFLFVPRNARIHAPLSLLLVLILLLQFHFAARSIGVYLPWQQLLGLGPLILVAASLPSFFGGWGVREVASALLFAHAGAHASAGVAVSLVFGVFAALASLPNLLVLLLRFDAASDAPR